MSAELRDFEDIQWFIFRYSSLKEMPYSELGTHFLGSADRTITHHGLRLQVKASASKGPEKVSGLHVANAAFPRMLGRGGQGFMHGPRSFETLPDTSLNRAKLYISLIAYLADFPKKKEKCLLNLWLPPTLASHNEEREAKHRGKYPYKPVKQENFNPLEMTPTLLSVDYNYAFIHDWINYAQHHPDYCMSPEWEYRAIDYTR